MAKAGKQVSVTLHVTVEVTDEAALFAASAAATDSSLPEAIAGVYATEVAAALQFLITPERVVANIPGVAYRACRYQANEAAAG